MNILMKSIEEKVGLTIIDFGLEDISEICNQINMSKRKLFGYFHISKEKEFLLINLM